MPEPSDRIIVPGDLINVGDRELNELHDQVLASFNEIKAKGPGNYVEQDLAYGFQLRDDLNRIKAELSAREVRARTEAESARLKAERVMNELDEAINGPVPGSPEAAAAEQRTGLAHEEAIAAAAARGVMTAMAKVYGEKRGVDVTQATERMVASLGATARVAPDPVVPAPKLSVTASGNGADLPDIAALAAEFTAKANNIPATALGREAPRHPVARVRNDFSRTVNERSGPYVVQEIWEDLVSKGNGSADALVAAGGWCAPSEIRYDFFNIAGMPRMIDLPTVGVQRGGIQWPVSPAIGDVFFQNVGTCPASGFGNFAFEFSSSTDPWLWTEADDQATVTGSGCKPTLRVPCPEFSEARLECYGLTLTAGNLTDSAYPEATQNFLKLLRAAYQHAINARLIGLVQTACGASSGTFGAAATALVPQLPNAAALAATDYRNRYAMEEDAVLEIIYPFWILEAMRSDLGYKPGLDDTNLLAVVDATIMGLYTSRNIRPQFISDWQVRAATLPGFATPITAWPTAVNFMIYAAGTFLHGTGLSLDLGIIRDSVLNAENDYTAAWAEECHLIAQVGHAGRIYTVNFNVGGNVAAGVTGAKV
jgi:hypothetical protein